MAEDDWVFVSIAGYAVAVVSATVAFDNWWVLVWGIIAFLGVVVLLLLWVVWIDFELWDWFGDCWRDFKRWMLKETT